MGKKYFVATVVALMTFAFAAFAASLQVNAGVLQAGEDDDLTCTEAATVTEYRFHEGHETVEIIRMDFGEECAGAQAILTIFGPDDTLIHTTHEEPVGGDGMIEAAFTVEDGLFVEDIERIRVTLWATGATGS